MDPRGDHKERVAGVILVVLGFILAAASGVVALISHWLAANPYAGSRLGFYTAGSMALGVLYLVAVWATRWVADSRLVLGWIIGVGLAARVVLVPSTPLLEVDYPHYLWEGAMTAHGINPYAHSPADFRTGGHGEALPAEFQRLAREGRSTLDRIGSWELTSNYPPLAQGVFAAAYWLAPFSIPALRVVFLAFDLATVVLLLRLLPRLALPRCLVLIYWWNPLFIQMTYAGAHMDVLVLPMVLAALLLALRPAPVQSFLWLALAVGVKVWPLALLPACWQAKRRCRRAWRIPALLLFGLVVGVVLWPYLAAAGGGHAGSAAYASQMENNDGLFRVQRVFWEMFAGTRAGLITRGVTACILGAWVLYLARRPMRTAREIADAFMLATAALFLLMPAQFPWYYTWLLPFLVLRPSWSLLAYTTVLPLYYWFEMHPAVVWAEHGPIWVLILAEWLMYRRQPTAAGPSV